MKVLFVILGITFFSIAPVNAATTLVQPNLSGWICIDQKGVHYSPNVVFKGVYCTLVPNPFYKSR